MLQQMCRETTLIMMLLKAKAERPNPMYIHVNIYMCASINRVMGDTWV